MRAILIGTLALLFSMFLCQVELNLYWKPATSPNHFIVATYGFDPGLQDQDEFSINGWTGSNEVHALECVVVGRKKEVYPDGGYFLENLSCNQRRSLLQLYPRADQALQNGANVLLLRIFAEAKDRSKAIEIRDQIASLNR